MKNRKPSCGFPPRDLIVRFNGASGSIAAITLLTDRSSISPTRLSQFSSAARVQRWRDAQLRFAWSKTYSLAALNTS